MRIPASELLNHVYSKLAGKTGQKKCPGQLGHDHEHQKQVFGKHHRRWINALYIFGEGSASMLQVCFLELGLSSNGIPRSFCAGLRWKTTVLAGASFLDKFLVRRNLWLTQTWRLSPWGIMQRRVALAEIHQQFCATGQRCPRLAVQKCRSPAALHHCCGLLVSMAFLFNWDDECDRTNRF